jgi:hypothetical protein
VFAGEAFFNKAKPMNEVQATAAQFSLLGGPLHRLGCRAGLVRGGTNAVALGLAIGFFLWIVLMVLGLVQGVGLRMFSLEVIGAHVRLLVVIPLFFLCEGVVDPRMRAYSATIVRSEVVPRETLPLLEAEIVRIARWRDSWLPEAVFLSAVVLMSLVWPHSQPYGATAAYDPGRSLAGLWYWAVCLPLFRFLILRWLWRLGLWWFFLWRVSRLPLRLVPTHPDGAAGLGYLEVVQAHFVPLVLAISAIQSASFAEELVAGTMTFEALYPALALTLAVDAALFLGPLLFFVPALWACRVKGMADYMEFAERYVNGFDRKWLRGGADPEEPLLGTSDIQSLADLNNSVNIVSGMRLVPASTRLAVELAIAAALPMLPLFLIRYPIAELIQKFVERLSGL